MISSNVNLLGDGNYLLFPVIAMGSNGVFDQNLL